MRKFGFFGSLLTAVIFAAVVFFALYFFVPSVSMQFFGFSWQGEQDTKAMKSVVQEILEDADLPKSKIEEYMARWVEADFQKKLVEATAKGKDATVDFLTSLGDGIDFQGLDLNGLKSRFEKAFSDSALANFSRRQVAAIKRLFSGALENL